MKAHIHAPSTEMSLLVDEIRSVFNCFINPDSDCLGHTFPIEHSISSSHSMKPGGLYYFEAASTVKDFAKSLVQATAIIGVDRALQLLADWKSGEPFRFRTCTFIHGLILNEPLLPREDIQIIPMPLSTIDLPRLPSHNQLVGQDYLGLTVLSLSISTSTAFFRPKTDRPNLAGQSQTVNDINFDVVCDALSLLGNCYVSQSLVWSEYEDATPFSLKDWDAWALGNNYFERAPWKMFKPDNSTGAVSIERRDDASIATLDEGELRRTIEALQITDKKLCIAVDRWKRSKRQNAPLEDRYIDLRIALETLYLKDFRNEKSNVTEMRFRLSLFGAWHLGSTVGERQDIRKTLLDAYDTASGAVHSGEVQDNSKECLEKAQDLCRRGILKFLHEGAPKDWGNLILGGPPL